jgi:hypothetical protein
MEELQHRVKQEVERFNGKKVAKLAKFLKSMSLKSKLYYNLSLHWLKRYQNGETSS